MILYHRMLVALSGTEADRPLIRYAAMLAAMRFARHFYFVHVRTAARIVDEQWSDAEVQRKCEAQVAEGFISETYASSSCHVIQGVRVDMLIEFATEQRCDVVLLGHRNVRSGQRSLARRLAMIAPCSVWLVPEGAPVSIANILVPIDFSDHAADSLSVASRIANAVDRQEITAVHVFADPAIVRYDEHRDEIRRNEHEAFARFLEPIDRQGVNVEPTFVEGNNVAGTILHVAKRHGADLLVTNTRGRSRSASILLGSITAQLMSESPIAVLTVKHFGAMMNLFQALQQSQFWTRHNLKTN